MNTYAYYFDDLVFYHGLTQSMVSGKGFFDHMHLSYEFYYFIEGDIEYVVENQRYRLHPGDLLFIKPGEHHFFTATSDKPYERLVVNFPESLAAGTVGEMLAQKGRHYAVGDTELAELFRRMDRHAADYSGDALLILMRSCLDELLVKFAFLEAEECPSQRINEQVSAIARYINTNLHLPLAVDDICQNFGISRSYLFKSFAESFHESPKQYIVNKKIMHAKQLLAAGEKPTVVCEKCGFSDYSTFYRAYQRIVGAPPSGQNRTAVCNGASAQDAGI